jgi:oxygen-independent coproporphyrinogen-3 oxidase
MTAQHSSAKPPEPETTAAVQEPCSALYLHVPFCLQKCPYCSFFSLEGAENLHKLYVQAAKKQIMQLPVQKSKETYLLETIFFGGGTPTVLSADTLATLLAVCLHAFPSAHPKDMEISIELNPATTGKNGLQTLRRAGFNRLSIGMQSLNDAELQVLGRPHTAVDAIQSFRNARQAGFANISLDLMYGLPTQKPGDWQQSLEQALALEPEHLSLYELTIEKNTPFARLTARGELRLPPEDDILAMMETTGEMTEQAGFVRYEISNYARPSGQCRHNINYWQNRSYIGIGAGAVSCLAGKRYRTFEDIGQFIKYVSIGKKAWAEEEILTVEERFRETVIMGLRMVKGVSLSSLKQRFGIDLASYYGPVLTSLTKQHLLQITQDRLHLTKQGLLLANTVMAELV